MLKSSLCDYSDTYILVNYPKTSGCLWHYYRDGPDLTDAGALDNFPRKSASFTFKQKITGLAGDDDIKDVKIMVQLKFLENS